MYGGEDKTSDDAERVIALPRRELPLGEPPERPPAEVIAFPAREARDRPPDEPPRLAL
jgi:hypothetical protein